MEEQGVRQKQDQRGGEQGQDKSKKVGVDVSRDKGKWKEREWPTWESKGGKQQSEVKTPFILEMQNKYFHVPYIGCTNPSKHVNDFD